MVKCYWTDKSVIHLIHLSLAPRKQKHKLGSVPHVPYSNNWTRGPSLNPSQTWAYWIVIPRALTMTIFPEVNCSWRTSKPFVLFLIKYQEDFSKTYFCLCPNVIKKNLLVTSYNTSAYKLHPVKKCYFKMNNYCAMCRVFAVLVSLAAKTVRMFFYWC